MKKIFIAAIVLIVSATCQAQGGYFGIGTLSSHPFTNVTGTGAQTAAVANIGQSSHWLTLCVTGGTVSALSLQLEASFDGTNWFAITEQANPTASGAFTGCQVLEASGYFPQLRVDLLSFNSAGGGVLNVWYSATQTAISSDGLLRSGKSSQPVTFVPNVTFTSTALKSTPASLSTSASSIYSISIFNPNASTVFVVVTPVTTQSGSTTTAVYGVAAGASRDISIPNGMQAAASSTVACATSAAGTGDPTTGCVVTMNLKGFSAVTAGPQNGNVIPN
ncbi:MAG TPA: hypothetical protein VFB79_06155 [Candidatus Angelobacter sp.]|nr:hypothetical protein [Candidatus Angelobacter sp.]